ncbi:ATP-binding protein [Candidatus Viridilinea mediisalina]|nr:ATP-binding protein [Candidatus Viridilinea mediisalina]
MFVNRKTELAQLDGLLRRGRGELLLLYGRRRVGKTALLREWASRTGVAWSYWMAQKEPAELQRRRLAATLRGRPPAAGGGPIFPSWSDLWDDAAALLRRDRHILILDELPWAVEADGAMLSALQYAWDIHWQHGQLILVLCGSQIRTMETILSQQTPLFGRLTAQYYLQPLAFGALRHFFPSWSPEAQVATYAMLGGVPQYLTWFEPERTLVENIRGALLAPMSVALAEIELLLADEVRDLRTYLAVLNAIGEGQHTLKAIADTTFTASTNLTKYLAVLQELRLVERRIPATVHPSMRHRSKQGRYHLTDPFHRFYFRFLRPHQAEIAYQPDQVLAHIQAGLRAFVGQTAWEELARAWVQAQGACGALPFAPEVIGSHWDRRVQSDVVALSWRERTMLIGECKWGAEPVNRQTLRHLLEQTIPKTLAALPDGGQGWRVIPALFARAGTTPDALALLQEHQGLHVDLARLYAALGDAEE